MTNGSAGREVCLENFSTEVGVAEWVELRVM